MYHSPDTPTTCTRMPGITKKHTVSKSKKYLLHNSIHLHSANYSVQLYTYIHIDIQYLVSEYLDSTVASMGGFRFHFKVLICVHYNV